MFKAGSVIIIIILTLIIFIDSACAVERSAYEIWAEYLPYTQTVNCRQRVDVVNTGNASLDSVYFKLYHNALSGPGKDYFRRLEVKAAAITASGDFGSIEVDSALVENEKRPFYFNEDSTIGIIPLRRALSPGKSIEIEIPFTLDLPPLVSRWGYFRGGALMAHWYPHLCPLTDSGWLVRSIHPFAESMSDFADYRVRIKTPRDLKVAATGDLADTIAEDDKLIYEFNAIDVVDFAWSVGEYNVFADEYDNVRIELYLLDEYGNEADNLLYAAEKTIEFMEENIGEYPYPVLRIAQAPVEKGGIEFPMMVTVGLTYMPFEFNRINEYAVIHEVLHQYFYAAVASDQFGEGWLDEGMVTCFTGKVEESSGINYIFDLFGIRIKPSHLLRTAVYTLPRMGSVTAPATDYNRFDSYSLYVYAKAAMFFQSVEGIVGTEEFYQLISKYYRQYKFKHATGSDLLDILKPAIDSTGINSADIIDFYLYEDRSCDYSIENVDIQSSTGDDSVVYNTNIIVENSGSGWLPVYLTADFHDGSTARRLIDEEKTFYEIELTSSSYPVLIEIDPEGINRLDKNLIDNSYSPSGSQRAKSLFQTNALFYLESFISLITGL